MRYKYGIAPIIGVLLFASATPAHAALTDFQIQAILGLLSSFGVDATTVTNVSAILRGTSTGSIKTTTPNSNTPSTSSNQSASGLAFASIDQILLSSASGATMMGSAKNTTTLSVYITDDKANGAGVFRSGAIQVVDGKWSVNVNAINSIIPPGNLSENGSYSIKIYNSTNQTTNNLLVTGSLSLSAAPVQVSTGSDATAVIDQSTFNPGIVTLTGTVETTNVRYTSIWVRVSNEKGEVLTHGQADFDGRKWWFTPAISLTQPAYHISVYGYPDNKVIGTKLIKNSKPQQSGGGGY